MEIGNSVIVMGFVIAILDIFYKKVECLGYAQSGIRWGNSSVGIYI